MVKVSLLKSFLSYFLPIRIQYAKGKTTPIIGLYRYWGRWQLSAATALYSDGAAYTPLTKAFNFLKNELADKQTMLVLGAGLGSAISVLKKRNNPIKSTLIEIDPQIIAWGKEIHKPSAQYPCDWICADVQEYVNKANLPVYDLVVLDIFQDRVVPQFVGSKLFLRQCHQLLKNEKSVLIFNYIINNENHWQEIQKNIESHFRVAHIISVGINRIMILRKIA